MKLVSDFGDNWETVFSSAQYYYFMMLYMILKEKSCLYLMHGFVK